MTHVHSVLPALLLGEGWEVFRTPISAIAVYELGDQATVVEFTDYNSVDVVKIGSKPSPIDEDGCIVLARAIFNCKRGWNMDTPEIDPETPEGHWTGESPLLPISFDYENILYLKGVSSSFEALVAMVYAWHGQDRENIEVTGSDEDGYEYKFVLGDRHWHISVSPNLGLDFIKVIPE
jgi:hypothetical protein